MLDRCKRIVNSLIWEGVLSSNRTTAGNKGKTRQLFQHYLFHIIILYQEIAGREIQFGWFGFLVSLYLSAKLQHQNPLGSYMYIFLFALVVAKNADLFQSFPILHIIKRYGEREKLCTECLFNIYETYVMRSSKMSLNSKEIITQFTFSLYART